MIEVEREDLFALMQADSELSDILMRAFILRRVELIAHRIGDAVLLGSSHSSETLRIREFLTRNGHPYAYTSTSTKMPMCRNCSIIFTSASRTSRS